MVSVLAIVCVRNEAVHIERCLNDLINSGCDVVLVDNGSEDDTTSRAESFVGRGLLQILQIPWTGCFSLSEQLRAKRRVVESSTHDWIVHADADEWLVSPTPGESLGEAISQADSEGYTVVNFHECVFIPREGEDFYRPDYASRMRDYYFFQPHYPRLNRAWRRNANLDNGDSGGHVLRGAELRRSPRDLLLRHYIVLSQAHAAAKYVGRAFSEEDMVKGWHGNRRTITPTNIRLRLHPCMRRLSDPLNHHQFDLTEPASKHYWDWPA